jgi:hypothetical protein
MRSAWEYLNVALGTRDKKACTSFARAAAGKMGGFTYPSCSPRSGFEFVFVCFAKSVACEFYTLFEELGSLIISDHDYGSEVYEDGDLEDDG